MPGQPRMPLQALAWGVEVASRSHRTTPRRPLPVRRRSRIETRSSSTRRYVGDRERARRAALAIAESAKVTVTMDAGHTELARCRCMFLRRLKAFGHFAIDYLDLLIAAGLAVLFSYMGARNTLHDDGLTQATIALLGVLSLVIFRERWERKKIVDKVDSAMASVGSAKPWHVLEDVTTWDIKRPELATTTSVKDLRFLHNEVVSIYEFQAITTGAVTMPTYRGGAVGGPQVDLPLAERFTAGGRTYLLISL